jgi:hypothetical protein
MNAICLRATTIVAQLTCAKNSFPVPIQAHPAIQPVPEEYSSFFLSEIVIDCRRPVSIRGALRGRHER